MFRVGEKVYIKTETGEELGKIERELDENVYLVKLANGNLVKCMEADIIPLPEEYNDSVSEEDFDEAVKKVSTPSYFVGKGLSESTSLILSTSAVAICNELRRELFGAR